MTNAKSITPLPPANFTQDLGNYKTLQPFRYWCQKVLPLVYDDSLSYYELLCKVVDYLNKTMEDVETLHDDVTNLHTAYEELQSYVNNYFSNLDVQEVINNKLDNMADSGELYEIIRRYTDPIANEQNEKITVLEARMSTFTSLPEGATSGDAELTDIRVGYDGTVYPSAADAVRDQVSSLNSDLDSKIIVFESVNKANPKDYQDGFILELNVLNLNQGYAHTGFIRCKSGDLIRTLRCGQISEYHIVQYYDKNKNCITNSYTTVTDNEVAEFIVPNNSQIYYCVVNFRSEKTDTFMVTVNSDYPLEYERYYHLNYLNNIQEKPIKGTILFSGDSICYGAEYSGGYAKLIQERNPIATITNYGISGTTVAKRTGRTDSILERIDIMQNEADFVVLEGGVNDAWVSDVAIGTFNERANVSTSETFDETTFCGAMESMFKKAFEKWSNAHIMFVIANVADHYNTYPYLDKAKEICKKWNVIPIDIRESGLNLMIKECVQLYGAYGKDNTHPSQLGYEKFYVPMIENEIKKFL